DQILKLETVHTNDLRAYWPHLEEVARKLSIPYEVAYEAAYPRIVAQDEFLPDIENKDKETASLDTCIKSRNAIIKHGLSLKEVRRGSLCPLVTEGWVSTHISNYSHDSNLLKDGSSILGDNLDQGSVLS
ncbi:hypothetical protein HK096_008635, partial [Nowakowskiella sp. JEL0078]